MPPLLRLLPLAVLLACLALAPAAGADDDPFAGNGMWIWQVPRAAGGDPAGIAERARAANIDTLFIKAAHGPAPWSQFSPELVAALKAEGLNVCGYQRLLGTSPTAEAAAAATAVTAGADCFVIDAEVELEGKYRQARTYMKSLRKRIGPDFPVGFTSFPYVSLHPLEPYSVFLGEGGATVNLPQIYWKAIGHSPSVAFARTVADNSVYGKPLAPIGQLYEGPRRSDVLSFRRLGLAYDVTGVSWWSWDSASTSGWAALTPRVGRPALPAAQPTYPTVRPGSRSDYVVWAKDHLRERGYTVTTDTRFDTTTRRAVQAFQADSGLAATGTLDPATWSALLSDDGGDTGASAG
ncbi:peptidoglycan-binding domain-containing protein [Capillimicrobium parvum]|uniref:peptidoglycan-binding domain-containing protein n=1 Tax=Capillimicrobium parvum TaxID=2884022 RepID=UPI00216B0D40|nr:peptidoglycan-binding domain-containing protein [Capillimicrobium parvum]